MADVDRGDLSDNDSHGVQNEGETPVRKSQIQFKMVEEDGRGSPWGGSIGDKASPRPDEEKNSNDDVDHMGREKIRITIQGKRATLVTTDMDDHHYEKLKKKSRKTTMGGEMDAVLDLNDLAEITGEGLKHEDKVQEHEETMGQMRKQMGMLVTTMTAQSIVLLALMVLVAWLFKDQYVSDDGRLTDSDGNVLKIGSADFSVASNGLLTMPSSNAAVVTQPLQVKISANTDSKSARRRLQMMQDMAYHGREFLRRELTELKKTRRLFGDDCEDGFDEMLNPTEADCKMTWISDQASCTALNPIRRKLTKEEIQIKQFKKEEDHAEIRRLTNKLMKTLMQKAPKAHPIWTADLSALKSAIEATTSSKATFTVLLAAKDSSWAQMKYKFKNYMNFPAPKKDELDRLVNFLSENQGGSVDVTLDVDPENPMPTSFKRINGMAKAQGLSATYVMAFTAMTEMLGDSGIDDTEKCLRKEHTDPYRVTINCDTEDGDCDILVSMQDMMGFMKDMMTCVLQTPGARRRILSSTAKNERRLNTFDEEEYQKLSDAPTRQLDDVPCITDDKPYMNEVTFPGGYTKCYQNKPLSSLFDSCAEEYPLSTEWSYFGDLDSDDLTDCYNTVLDWSTMATLGMPTFSYELATSGTCCRGTMNFDIGNKGCRMASLWAAATGEGEYTTIDDSIAGCYYDDDEYVWHQPAVSGFYGQGMLYYACVAEPQGSMCSYFSQLGVEC